MNNNTKKFYLISVLITWFLWILAIILGSIYDVEVLYNEKLYDTLKYGFKNINQIIISIIFGLAVYGPLIGFLLFKRKDKNEKINDKPKILNTYLFIFLYPIIIFGLSVLLSQVFTGFSKALININLPLWFLPLIFIYQIFTSGTEEFGWRGFLQPELEKKYSFEKASYLTGILWSIWHYPFIIFINLSGGIGAIIPSLVGFTLLTIPKALIIAYVYKKTNSIWACVLLHAFANTMSYYILSLSPVISISSMVVAVLTWLLADRLNKKINTNK